MRKKRRREVRENLIVSLQKEKTTMIADKDNQLKAKDREIAAITASRDEQLKAKDELISVKESEVCEKNRSLVSLQQRCGSLQTQLETVQRRNQSLEVSGFSCY